jgi:pantothenate kinase
MNPRQIEWSLEELISHARALAHAGHRRVLGITGPPGAGKSTVARTVVDALGSSLAVLVPMDGFHLANEVLISLGRRQRKGAPDTFDAGGYAALLHRIRRQLDAPEAGPVYAPLFDRDLEEPIANAIPVEPSVPLVVTEGNYLLLDQGAWPEARDTIDEIWYLALPDEVRLERLIRRHVRHGKTRAAAEDWARGTDQRNAMLIERFAASADLVVSIID